MIIDISNSLYILDLSPAAHQGVDAAAVHVAAALGAGRHEHRARGLADGGHRLQLLVAVGPQQQLRLQALRQVGRALLELLRRST